MALALFTLKLYKLRFKSLTLTQIINTSLRLIAWQISLHDNQQTYQPKLYPNNFERNKVFLFNSLILCRSYWGSGDGRLTELPLLNVGYCYKTLWGHQYTDRKLLRHVVRIPNARATKAFLIGFKSLSIIMLFSFM